MWKALFCLFLITPAYAQVFTEDIAKINHVLGEQAVDDFLKKPSSEGIPEEYLQSLMAQKYLSSSQTCLEDPHKYKPKNQRYKVIVVAEDNVKSTFVVAQHKNELAEVLVNKAQTTLRDVASGGDKKFVASFAEGTNTDVIKYVAPETQIKVNSGVTAEASYAVELEKNPNELIEMGAGVEVDWINRVEMRQKLGTAVLTSSIQASHTTDYVELSSNKKKETEEKVKLNFDKVSAGARIDAPINENVKSFTQVEYLGKHEGQDAKLTTGINISAPDNAQVMIFTSYRARGNGYREAREKSDDAEVGFEYTNKNGVKLFGRVRDISSEDKEPVYETGIELKLGK